MSTEAEAFPSVSSLPAWLVPSVYLNWSTDWLRESIAIATNSREHALPGGPDGPKRGDVVVTVLGDAGVVASVELMGASDGDSWITDELFGPDRPIVWADLFDGADAYLGSSGWLPAEHARAVLDGIANQFHDGPVHTIDPGDCGAGEAASDVHVLRIIGHRAVSGWAMRREERCATCERFVDVHELQVHDDGAVRLGTTTAGGRTLEQVVRDVHLMCRPCHDLMHAHSVSAQRSRLRPQCPGCGVRGRTKRIVWGMTFHDDVVSAEPDVVYGGFEVPVPAPEWYCTECHANFGSTVVASRVLDAQGPAVPQPVTGAIRVDLEPAVAGSASDAPVVEDEQSRWEPTGGI
ncbi:hypothetical protein [Isoptericola aurantiacus]|uniref:hypothetical protein n=1 Tax=Isoptericola aurantiacus TaxID=3377839 RepID=UPI00383A4557